MSAIAAGSIHSLALKNDGTVWSWGDNDEGQLGNGTITFSDVPVQVKDLTGASRAVAFTNGVVRRSERSPHYKKDGTTVPGRFAHCDFSPNPSGSRAWAEALLPPDDVQALTTRRFAIYNVWRVLSPPPQDTPLALCDAGLFRFG